MTIHTQAGRRTRARGISLLMAFLATLAVLVAPAAWGAADPAPQQSENIASGTWEGRVERHADHFDYRGLPCPTEDEVCIQILVSYEIVPTTDQARHMLPVVAGGQAELVGTRYPAGDDEHQGILFVEQVTPSTN